jgi:hypothetical protein
VGVSVSFTGSGATGSATITDETVNLNIDAGASGSAILTIEKSGVAYEFDIAIGESQTNRPNNKYPSNGD